MNLLDPLAATTSEANRLVRAITWHHSLIRTLHYDDTRYHGDEFVEAACVCIGVDFLNLASPTLARSMEQFICRHTHWRGIRLLVTFVRAAFEESMIKAFRVVQRLHKAGYPDAILIR